MQRSYTYTITEVRKMTAPPVVDPNKPPASQPVVDPAGSTKPVIDPAKPATEISGQPSARESLLLEEIRRIGGRQEKLEQQLAESKKPPEPSVADKTKEFYDNPTKVIEEALKKTVQPLIEFRDEFKAQSAYEKLKVEFKSDPTYSAFLATPGVESAVDQLMSKNAPTPESMRAVILGVKGGIDLGIIKLPTTPAASGQPANQPPAPAGGAPKVPDNLPPHLRPSAPPGPADEKGDSKTSKYKAMAENANENQRRLARENGLSLEEYFEMNDVNPLDVVFSKVGIKEEKK
jgi:hypothetical protein